MLRVPEWIFQYSAKERIILLNIAGRPDFSLRDHARDSDTSLSSVKRFIDTLVATGRIEKSETGILSLNTGNKKRKVTVSSGIETDPEQFPEHLKDKFRSQKKDEVDVNVWLTQLEYNKLMALFGEAALNDKILNISDWSMNPNPDKTGKPSYLKYRKYVDHYLLIKNSLSRDRAEKRGFYR